MAMKKKVLVFIVPAQLMSSWPDVAVQAGFSVRLNSDPYEVCVANGSHEESIVCRSGVLYRGDISVVVTPSAGSPPASKSPVAGRLVILIFYSKVSRKRGFGDQEYVLAREFGETLISAGAIAVPEHA